MTDEKQKLIIHDIDLDPIISFNAVDEINQLKSEIKLLKRQFEIIMKKLES